MCNVTTPELKHMARQQNEGLALTTYRLSINAKAECRSLGVQIWGLPELIYLCCTAAPDTVFDGANNYAFSKAAFNQWWKLKNQSRLMAV
jgi:hypothetical protein